MATLKVDRDRLRELHARRPGAAFERQEKNAQALYGSPYNHAFTSFGSKMRARFSDDAEALGHLRDSISQLEAFGKRRGMSGEAMHGMLSRVYEYVEFPRDASTQETIANNTFEAKRLELGSTEKATQLAERFNTFMNDLRTEAPYIGHLATTHGARVDRQFVELGARYSEHE